MWNSIAEICMYVGTYTSCVFVFKLDRMRLLLPIYKGILYIGSENVQN